MLKPGRNSPCHCGSGKKYKRCCLGTDAEQNSEEVFLSETGKLPGIMRDEEDLDTFNDDDIDVDSLDENETFDETNDDPLIDNWWEKYHKLKDYSKMESMLDSFLMENPDRAEDLEPGEALFLLEPQSVKEGKEDSFIEFLVKYREQFPDLYFDNFPYHDYSLICGKVIKNDKNDIPELLKNFRKHPIKETDCLLFALEFLSVNNCQDIIAELVMDIYEEVCSDPDIINAGFLTNYIVLIYQLPYLKPDFTDDDMENLVKNLKKIKIELIPDYYDSQYLKDIFSYIFSDYTGMNIENCNTKDKLGKRYYELALNFMRFLHDEKDKDWMASETISMMVLTYLDQALLENKLLSDAFIFTKDSIEKTIAEICSSILGLNSVKCFSTLSGIYYFSEYLELINVINAKKRADIQQFCADLHKSVYKTAADDLSKRAFEKFPV